MFRFLHAGLNGEDEADSFECEDCRADSECEISRIEQFDSGVEASHTDDCGNIIPIDICQADKNKNISEKSCTSQFGNVADVRERDQGNQLDANECID